MRQTKGMFIIVVRSLGVSASRKWVVIIAGAKATAFGRNK